MTSHSCLGRDFILLSTSSQQCSIIILGIISIVCILKTSSNDDRTHQLGLLMLRRFAASVLLRLGPQQCTAHSYTVERPFTGHAQWDSRISYLYDSSVITSCSDQLLERIWRDKLRGHVRLDRESRGRQFKKQSVFVSLLNEAPMELPTSVDT